MLRMIENKKKQFVVKDKDGRLAVGNDCHSIFKWSYPDEYNFESMWQWLFGSDDKEQMDRMVEVQSGEFGADKKMKSGNFKVIEVEIVKRYEINEIKELKEGN